MSFLGLVVEDLDLLAVAHELGDAVERDVFTVVRVVELAVRIPLDHAGLVLPQTSRSRRLARRRTRVKLARSGHEIITLESVGGFRCWGIGASSVSRALFRRAGLSLDEIEMRVGLVCERLETLPLDDALRDVLGPGVHRSACAR